ncbi:hypothetical protein VTJ04DRAFT_3568 [Mycothermus thermophilus]|uniref:uncharacterized protein n=1 Tax=Humicola insolens TaxID=85995 RepID=UPI0037425498
MSATTGSGGPGAVGYSPAPISRRLRTWKVVQPRPASLGTLNTPGPEPRGLRQNSLSANSRNPLNPPRKSSSLSLAAPSVKGITQPPSDPNFPSGLVIASPVFPCAVPWCNLQQGNSPSPQISSATHRPPSGGPGRPVLAAISKVLRWQHGRSLTSPRVISTVHLRHLKSIQLPALPPSSLLTLAFGDQIFDLVQHQILRLSPPAASALAQHPPLTPSYRPNPLLFNCFDELAPSLNQDHPASSAIDAIVARHRLFIITTRRTDAPTPQHHIPDLFASSFTSSKLDSTRGRRCSTTILSLLSNLEHFYHPP